MSESSACSESNDADQLNRLSEQINRVAIAISRVASRQTLGAVGRTLTDGTPAPSADYVREVIRVRRLREQFWESDLFADPAWDMMLDLYHAELSGLRIAVSSLCVAAAVPPTTAMRWIKTMVAKGLIVRRADAHDGRRVFIELTEQTSETMKKFFHSTRQRTVL